MVDRYLKIALTLNPGDGLTLATVQDMEAAFRTAYPTGRMTWNLGDAVAGGAEWATIRAFVADCITEHGDQATYWNGFPGRFKTMAQIQADMDAYIPMVMANTGCETPGLSGWFFPAQTMAYVRDVYDVRTIWGAVWSQNDVDGFSGEGSVNVPYYPSTTHGLIPGADDDMIDMLVCDVANQYHWAAQTDGIPGRQCLHPVDAADDELTGGPIDGLDMMKHISTGYLTDESSGPIRYLDNVVEVDWVNSSSLDPRVNKDGVKVALKRWKDWIAWMPGAFPDLQPVTLAEFGDAWRELYPTNSWAIQQTGTKYGDPSKALIWLFTNDRRVCVKVEGDGLGGQDMTLIDLVRYQAGIGEPVPPAEEWGLGPLGVVWQKEPAHWLTNPYLRASYRDLEPLLRHPSLTGFLRA